jgi:serine/threonine-protein kinase
MVTDRRRVLEDLSRLAATGDAGQLPEASVTRLASALSSLGSRETAIALLRRGQRVHPDDFWINMDLGRELTTAGQHDEAGRFFSAAVAIRPRSSIAHGSLARSLEKSGRLEEAADTFRQAILLRPDEPHQHIKLGAVLMSLGDSGTAQGEFFEAKCLRPDDWSVRKEIADVFQSRGRYEPAIAELREAASCETMKAYPHEALGKLLLEEGRLDEAVASLGQAVLIDPGFAPGHLTLGRALLAQGEFHAALLSFRRSQSSAPRSPYRGLAADLARDAERMIALNSRFPELPGEDEQPASLAERIRIAQFCQIKQLFATSAKNWEGLFITHPAVPADLNAGHRFAAACAAARAGSGQGKETPPPDLESRARLRRKALEWLEADLAAITSSMEKAHARDRHWGPSRLGRWLVATQLAGVRDESALSHLAEPEQKAWTALWSKVKATIEKATQTGAKTQSSRPT